MKRILQLLILTTLLIGCAKSGNESADSNELVNNQPTTEKLDNKSTQIKDVSEEFIDIQARIKRWMASIPAYFDSFGIFMGSDSCILFD